MQGTWGLHPRLSHDALAGLRAFYSLPRGQGGLLVGNLFSNGITDISDECARRWRGADFCPAALDRAGQGGAGVAVHRVHVQLGGDVDEDEHGACGEATDAGVPGAVPGGPAAVEALRGGGAIRRDADFQCV